jgi:hypothetical protein
VPQIAAAELRLAFSEEKRKLKEEILDLSARVTASATEAQEARRENSFLLRRVLDLEGAAERERGEAEEQMVALMQVA